MNNIKIVFCLACIFIFSGNISGQTLSVIMNKDTISLEEKITIKYSVDESCNHKDLEFPGFLPYCAPSIGKRTSIINGKRTASSSYTIILTPIEEGVFVLPEEYCGLKLDKPRQIVVIAGYESARTKEIRKEKERIIKKI